MAAHTKTSNLQVNFPPTLQRLGTPVLPFSIEIEALDGKPIFSSQTIPTPPALFTAAHAFHFLLFVSPLPISPTSFRMLFYFSTSPFDCGV
jgi:hypothetical protein